MERKEYEIAGRKFYQQELVWGQIKWITEYVKNCGIDVKSLSGENIFGLIMDELPKIMSFALIEEGQTPANKIADGIEKADELAVWFETNLTGSVATKVIADFFELNRPGLLMERVGGLFRIITMLTPAGSKTPSASSQTETSPGSPGSSETLPQESPSLISEGKSSGE